MAKFRETFITQEATSPQRSVLCSSKISVMIPSPGRVVISSDMLRLVATLSLSLYIYIYIGDNRMMAYAKFMRYAIIVAEKITMYKFQGAPIG